MAGVNMKKQICGTLCDIMDDYPKTTLFSIISIIILILAVIIEWMGMTNDTTFALCLGIPLCVGCGLVIAD